MKLKITVKLLFSSKVFRSGPKMKICDNFCSDGEKYRISKPGKTQRKECAVAMFVSSNCKTLSSAFHNQENTFFIVLVLSFREKPSETRRGWRIVGFAKAKATRASLFTRANSFISAWKRDRCVGFTYSSYPLITYSLRVGWIEKKYRSCRP